MVAMNEVPNVPLSLSAEQWRQKLSAWEYRVLREAATEPPGTGAYDQFFEPGTFVCAGCGTPLFAGDAKFSSGCGWPACFQPLDETSVRYIRDESLPGRPRTEVRCARCDGHLGHVFAGEGYDTPTDVRYCINSVCLRHIPYSDH